MVVVVLGLGIFEHELGGIDGGIVGQIHVPRPVEHSHGLVLLHSAHVLVGQRLTAETVGEHPGIGHDVMGIDQMIGGHLPLLGGSVLAVDGILDALHGQEGLHGGLGEGDRDLPRGGLLDAALIGVGVAHGIRHLPDTQTAARELVDADEVFPRGLLVEGQGGVAVIGVILNLLGSHGSGGTGGIEISIPLVQGQGQTHGLVAPGGHTEGELVEGRAKAHTDTDRCPIGELTGRMGGYLGGVKGLDGHGIVGCNVVVGGVDRDENGHGTHQHENGQQERQSFTGAMFHKCLLEWGIWVLYKKIAVLSMHIHQIAEQILSSP